jgi:hypothetical protein
MDISEVNKIVRGFKNMELDELNILFNDLCKTKKQKEKEYNDLVEQVYFIINELKKEIELKSFNIDSDSESTDEEYKLDIKLIEVYSDEE